MWAPCLLCITAFGFDSLIKNIFDGNEIGFFGLANGGENERSGRR